MHTPAHACVSAVGALTKLTSSGNARAALAAATTASAACLHDSTAPASTAAASSPCAVAGASERFVVMLGHAFDGLLFLFCAWPYAVHDCRCAALAMEQMRVEV